MKSEADYRLLAPGLRVAMEEVQRMKDCASIGQYKPVYIQALVEVETYLSAMYERAERGEYIHPVSYVGGVKHEE